MTDRDRYRNSTYSVSRDNGRREHAELDMREAAAESAAHGRNGRACASKVSG